MISRLDTPSGKPPLLRWLFLCLWDSRRWDSLFRRILRTRPRETPPFLRRATVKKGPYPPHATQSHPGASTDHGDSGDRAAAPIAGIAALVDACPALAYSGTYTDQQRQSGFFNIAHDRSLPLWRPVHVRVYCLLTFCHYSCSKKWVHLRVQTKTMLCLIIGYGIMLV